MEELTKLKESLSHERPAHWDNLPDIELYMDQVINYMPRQQVAYRAETQITPAMVNNYIKDGLLPHPNGKKYSKEHLANLTAICVLKQVLSVKDISLLLSQELNHAPTCDFYSKFNTVLDQYLTDISQLIPGTADFKELSDATLKLAVASYANKLACEHILDIIRRKCQESEEENKKIDDAAKTKKTKNNVREGKKDE